MTDYDVNSIVSGFYSQALTVNVQTTPATVLERILSEGFESINSQETKRKATLIQQIGYFWKLIPDLVWAPQDVVIGTDGRKVVVRSIASGSPKGSFMGLELDGSKWFRIDTTDILEVDGGQIVRAYHLEDWATAMRQLRG